MSSPEHDSARVLVVDDDAVTRVTVRDYLEEAGFSVSEAADGEAGRRELEQCRFDIALVDVVMPRIDGFALCELIRSTPGLEHLPVLMMTGSDDVSAVSRAFETGATDFITKPLNPDLLVHRVRYMLRAKRTADLLRKRERSLAYAERIARIGNWELDTESGELTCSDALNELIGFGRPLESRAELLSRVHPDERPALESALSRAAEEGVRTHSEFRVLSPDGDTVIVEQDAEPIVDRSGRVVKVLAALRDVTSQREAEKRIRDLAHYDPVTGLPNRLLLADELQQAIAAAARHRRTLAVLFVDLDHFKRINDTWGHPVGDEVLREVARRIRSCLRSEDIAARGEIAVDDAEEPLHTVARLGGDEFVVILREIRVAEDAAIVARRVGVALTAPLTVHATTVYVTASIGISVFPADADAADGLLKHADAAMYQAKARGRNGFRFYCREMQGHAYARLRVEAALRRALDEGAFELHYQPRIDLATNAPVGMEALVRWTDPELGEMSPAEFIPIAEETGLIVPLGRWVLETACRQARKWHDSGFDNLCVSVNLSVVQARQDDLGARVSEVLETTGLAPERLELELTEGLLMEDTQAHIRLMDALKSLGVRLSIDDFGTGYSSLQYLKRFPIDALKIDRCFVRDLETDRDDHAIVHGTISLAHSLGLRVVAEGVETRGQCERLRELRCDEVQGFYFARPLEARAFARWLADWQAPAAGERRAALR